MLNAWRERLISKEGDAAIKALYGAEGQAAQAHRERMLFLIEEYESHFGREDITLFSSPGRAEIGGNHTDHNKGCVLAAAVTLDMLCAAAKTQNNIVTLYSRGYSAPFMVDAGNLGYVPEEEGTSYALIRGILFKMRELGFAIGGFNAVMASNVLSGSGLSSSAAFEVLIATVLDGLYNGGRMDPVVRAKLCQWVENEYFGKPSGLLDQSASSVGGLISVDFGGEDPAIERTSYDFEQKGYCAVVLATRSSHDDLSDEYAAIPIEMKQVASLLGCEVLRQVDEGIFYENIAMLREKAGDRAVMRAMHFFEENRRVQKQVRALESDDLPAFLSLVVESGESSWRLLQNLYVGGSSAQSLALACALSEKLLKGVGAWRVHGGGFAGTILAFVPRERLNGYVAYMDGVFGQGACTVLGIRPVGATKVAL